MKLIALAVLLSTLGACAAHDDYRAAAEPKTAHQTAARRESQAVATAPTPEGMFEPAAPSEQHAWLQQLVGEWTFTCQATMAEGAAPFRMEGTESVSSIGGLWIVAEGRAAMGGEPMQSLMTLGYQPDQKAFVGTWLDSMQTHLWSYTGSLDAGRTKLTLDAEGPSFENPSQMSLYRDAIELKDKDHKVLTSSVQAADGTWTTFMRAEYSRTK